MDWKKAAFPIFIVAILTLSTFGVIIGGIDDTTNIITYNGRDYRANNQGWTTTIEGTNINFLYQPGELANATNITPITLQQLNQAEKIYLSITPGEDYQAIGYYIETKLRPYLRPLVVLACTKDNETCSNAPLKNCQNDAQPGTTIILEVHNSTNNQITYNNNCLTIDIEPTQADYYIEAFLFKLLQL
ncbi:MAG: hypothetical protein Q7R96_03940 [Nanoarchaeota archaeon]|nr:hypothetical protein [Nanoarchaeota archaeon]